ncbi:MULTISPECIES: ABC transporter substrate-binding protein [unclassified Lactococcus]|uniref:ABC transporter substrate-binding protein n=1 Tax=unclassified Lactococcus TaxID=2643510 RepID=UPI0011CB0448|nr:MULTISPECIES: ABC transporter substrate-binding protein [unclassified Lactococcus]MQW23674.1 extracellular solute-binding protein [Lactococcus sp. dk101]TXK37593.1 ABC transporter substrate-binding protein [Lactococcus sp. dk310]TXK49031.1 ABC transporter substrate-binding protein [Lactococcus sp. dk322]
MKKLLYFLIGIIAITAILGFTSLKMASKGGVKTDQNTLTIFNWGEYINPDLITAFEKETGYHVNYMTFDSNEAMYAKVKQGGTAYDIVVPSDYMIQKMANEGLLQKLDHSKIKGLSDDEPKLLNPSFDKGNQYSVPYFWGTLGIVYNDKYIQQPPVKFSDLWDKKYKNSIILTDDTRDVMGMGLIEQGFSVNSTNQSQINQAYNRLLQLTPNVKAILGDEVMNYMVNNETPMAVVYSGQAAEMTSANQHLHYIIPEKTNIWYDNLAIPKTAKNVKAAYAFINFMQRPENAASNADWVGYSTPNLKAKALLPKDVSSDKAFYPDEAVIKDDEAYTNLSPYWTGVYNDLYLQFKMNK